MHADPRGRARHRVRNRSALATIGALALLAGFIVGSAPPASAATCTNSWTNAAGGDFGTGGNWSAGHVPTNVEDTCITLAGTYTVTVSQGVAVRSLTLGGASGKQTLAIQNVNPNTALTASEGVSNGARGAIVLDGTTGTVFIDLRASLLTNAGTITMQGPANPVRINGDLTNTGTITVNADASLSPSIGTANIVNQGTIAVASGVKLSAYGGAVVTNGPGGQINAAGTGNLDVNGAGSTYNQGAGTTTGTNPVLVTGILNYTGAGASRVLVYGGTQLSGATVPGQTLTIRSGLNNTGASAAAGFTNGGTTILDGSAGDVFLDTRAAALTNTGTIVTQGATAAPVVNGDLTNTGTLDIKVNTAYRPSIGTANLLNQGTLAIASGAKLSATNQAVVNNAAGGKINATGTGTLDVNGGAYVQGAGTTSGTTPVRITGTLSYTGGGASSVLMYGGSALSGATVPGQTLTILSGSINTGATAASGFTNGGTIILDGVSGDVFLTVKSSTLTNTGTIRTQRTSGNVTLAGTVTNTGTIDVRSNTRYQADGGSPTITQTAGTTTVAADASLTLETGNAFALAGGTLKGAGTVAGKVDNTGGHVAPGASPGTLSITGTYTQGAGGTLDIEVTGTAAGQFDVLAVGTDVSLAGTLALQPSAGYAASATLGQTVTFLTFAGTRTGTFSTVTVTPPLAGGTPYGPLYSDAAKSVKAVVGAPLLYTPLAPVRILDSRPGPGNVGFLGKVQAGTPRALTVTGKNGVPVTASAVVVNVTATGGTANSFLTVFPTGGAVPNSSNLNFAAGQTIPNLVTVKVGAGGQISFANAAGGVDVVADIVGYYDAAALDKFTPLSPKRILDSRPGSSNVGFLGPVNAGSPRALSVTGATTGVPVTADAVVMNVTVTGGTANSFLTVFPTGTAVPTASNVNFAVGQTTPNLVIVKVGTGGQVSFANAAGGVEVIADLVGYFDAGGADYFHALAPSRILDSRPGPGNVGFLGAVVSGTPRALAVTGSHGVPTLADAIIANTTATAATANSFLTVYPTGAAVPNASNLNFAVGETIPNLVIVKAGSGGQVSFANAVGRVDVIADLVGYYAST